MIAASVQRLRHFADWSDNSSEYHMLREVEHSFVSTFLEPERGSAAAACTGPAASGTTAPEEGHADPGIVVWPSGQRERVCSLDQWLARWGTILDRAKTFSELPVWLQYFPRVMFQVINKSGTLLEFSNEFRSDCYGRSPFEDLRSRCFFQGRE